MLHLTLIISKTINDFENMSNVVLSRCKAIFLTILFIDLSLIICIF